jgi:hypothetical protein
MTKPAATSSAASHTPHAYCFPNNSRDKRAQEQQESRIGEDFLEMDLPPSTRPTAPRPPRTEGPRRWR